MTAVAALLAGLALSVGIAACGGQKIAADEVTVPPPELTVPTSSSGAADALAPDASPTATSTPGTTSTGSNDSGSGSDSTSGGGTSGGSATPAPQATATPSSGGAQAPTQSQPPSGGAAAPAPGSGSQKFEQFCEQNAGAC